MARYSGSGWHNQSIRHSNARKYGKAGGSYATKKRIDYQMAGTLGRWVVPKGTKVEPATNLPDKDKFWVVPDERMPKKTRELAKGMGILLEKDEVEKTPKAGWYDIGHKHYGKCENITIPRPKGLRANDLPIQIKMIIPSTKRQDEPISEEEFNKRQDEIKEYFDKKFGADTTITDTGGYFDGDKWITEKGNIVESSTTIDKYKKNINDVVKFIRQKRKEYRQDSMFLGIEGRSYIIPNKNYIDDDKSVKKKPILVT